MQFKIEFEANFPELSSRDRRASLINKMKELEARSIHCFDCVGNCCTFESNSMQATPIEALEVYWYLCGLSTFDTFIPKLKQTISEYRLDKEIPTGSGTFFRRTYTCPFFKGESKGCELSRGIKPYGCLGFNPNESGIREGENCSIPDSAFKDRPRKWRELETDVNNWMKHRLSLYWEKLPLPVALLRLHDVINL